MLKKRTCLVWLIAVIVVPSLIYYTAHFYFQQALFFTDQDLFKWTILVGLILLSIVLNLFQNHKINKLEYELFHYLQGNRELLLDMQEDLEEKDKNFTE